MRKNEIGKILLILDVDETLIHASAKELGIKADFKVFDYFIYKRPYLDFFLDEIKDHFMVAVWSSASDDYVNEIVKLIFPENFDLKFVWGRSRCTPKRFLNVDEYGNYDDRYLDHFNYVKPLKKVKKKGFDLNKILIIDDTPHKSRENYGNAIYPKEYLGDIEDDELKQLSKYLKLFMGIDNVRSIEKRNWRNEIDKQ